MNVHKENISAISLNVNAPGERFFFYNQHIRTLDEIIEFVKTRDVLAPFISDNTVFLGDNKQVLDQQHLTTAQVSGTLNITLSSPDAIATRSEIHKENLRK